MSRALRALTLILFFVALPAQALTIDASSLIPRLELTLSPTSGSFSEGATFDVPILINTKGVSVNGIEARILFDKSKLEVVKPSSGTSIIGVWIEPPSFDNTKGTASYVGVVPNGIITNSGLIGTITFRAKSTGVAAISFAANSRVLLNDGQGTEARVDLGRSTYSILAKAPEGVKVFSDTHPFSDTWYKNNSPVISWDKDPGVEGFSYVLDNIPNTIPESTILTKDETSHVYENLKDGLWYFHIKARKSGVWSQSADFLVRIDTTPPAVFTPTTNYVVAAAALVDRALVSFETTDNLSGVDHYEVGVIDKSDSTTVSPVFVQAESPFQVPLKSGGQEHVIVRAVDAAGNVRDAQIDVAIPSLVTRFLKAHLVPILLGIIMIGILGMILHYFVGHHIIRYWRRARQLMRQEELQTEVQNDMMTR